MQNQNIEVAILVNNGSVAEYRHDTGRIFVEGKEGSNYSLRIKNHNGHRVMVVVGVDGVNVIDSKPLGTSPNEAGYVIAGGDSLNVKGYRVNNDEVAAFRFTKADQAYASKDKGLKGTTGVISVRAYAEKEKPLPPPAPIIKEHHYHDHWRKWRTWPYDYEDSNWPFRGPIWTSTCGAVDAGASYTSNVNHGILRSANLSAKASAQAMGDTVRCSAPAESMQFSASISQDSADDTPFALGSSWGQKTESKVREVAFEVGSFLTEALLYYTTREGLKKLGIDLTRSAQVVFPDHSPGSYCEKPSGWRG